MNRSNLPKISVFVVTYNQENLISRALDSVLCQKEYLYELLVSDDCSTDNNWKVIDEYTKKHPDVVKAFRNEKNKGIYENIETIRSKCTGDLFVGLAGDDSFQNGYLAAVIDMIKEKKIDFKNELFCIYFDFIIIYPNGSKKIFKNNLIKNPKFNLVSLKIRGLINTRCAVCSTKLLPLYRITPKNIGNYCDELMDIQNLLLAEKNYYSPFIASSYYSHIGLSVKTNKEDYNWSMDQTTIELEKWIQFSKTDSNWLVFQHYRRRLLINPEFKLFIRAICYYFKGINLSYGFCGLGLRRWFIDLSKVLGVYNILTKRIIYK